MNNIKNIEKNIKKIEHQISDLMSELSELEQKKIDIIIDQGTLVTDLSEFEGKYISSCIRAFSSKNKEVFIPTNGTIKVKEGKLHCSSFEYGIVLWYKEKNCYAKQYHYDIELLDIVGFLNVKVDND